MARTPSRAERRDTTTLVGRDGFGQLVHAEWTKLRSVPSTAWCLLTAIGLMVGVAVLISSGNPGTYNRAAYVDEFRFVHQPLTGDGTVVARVTAQDDSHPWAMAGVMIKASTAAGAPYAAMMLTPGHGARMQADFTTDLAGSASTAPRWLRLTRVGTTVTGSESVDGIAWTTVGTVALEGLPDTVQVGLFVTSPDVTRVVPTRPTLMKAVSGRATFDSVAVTATAPQPRTTWQSEAVGTENIEDMADMADRQAPGTTAPAPVPSNDLPDADADADRAVTVSGSGDIIGQHDDGSRIVAAVAGTIAGLIPLAALGALVATGEYESRMIWTTLAATPRRGRVLAAKTAVLASVSFAAGLASTGVALLLAQPLLRRHGYRPPTYPDPSPFDPTLLRVVVGTAVVFTLVAVFSLGVATAVRHSAAAITVVVTVLTVPVIVAPFLPPAAGMWLQRSGPVAGLSIQQVSESDDGFLLPWVGHPWGGLAVLCAYAVAAAGVGAWRQRRWEA